MAGQSFVYWLFDETCTVPEESGYVGVTCRLEARIAAHRKKIPAFKFLILFSGTREECFAVEARFRPQHSIGWNNAAGGRNGYGRGDFYSEKTREKIAKAKIGKPRPDLARYNRTRTLSEETLKKMRAAAERATAASKNSKKFSGNHHSSVSREKISRTLKARYTEERMGGKPHFNAGRICRHSPETRAKMRIAALQRWDRERGQQGEFHGF